MRSISQYSELNDDLIRLKFLLDEKHIPIKNIESVIFCRMRNKSGCLLELCPHFESLSTSLIHREDRCSFPMHCGERKENLLLATYKISEYEEIEKVAIDIQKNIPKYVKRWHFRSGCEFTHLHIDMKEKRIYAIWEKKIHFLPSIEYKEDVFSASNVLDDKRAPFWAAIKRGEI